MKAHTGQVLGHSGAQVPERDLGRKRITRWGKGAYAGVIAGALFLAVEMFLIGVFGSENVWDPVRLSASIAMGNAVVPSTKPITTDILFIGLLVHFMVAIWYAVLLGMLVHKMKPSMAVLAGAGFGLLMYLFHFYGLAGMYPWVVDFRGGIALATHLIFGMAAARIYIRLNVRQLMREAGVEPKA